MNDPGRGSAEAASEVEDERDAAEAAAALAQLRDWKTTTRPWRELRSELDL